MKKPKESLLEVRNLKTTFTTRRGKAEVIAGVTFTVKKSGILGLIGESGSGKSMTAMSILRLISYPGVVDSKSEVIFDGKNLIKMSERELRKVRGNSISMIFQEPMTSLNPTKKIGAQVRETLLLHRQLTRREAKEKAIEMLRHVEIASPEKRYHEFPHQLSGGMRQRVMIALAMACEPKLIIADEPTTALDVTVQAQILNLMRTASRENGVSLIVITHDFGVVAEICDDVAVMYAGKIVERGPVARVFESPLHPYTKALMGSVPHLGMTRQLRLNVIPGGVPSILAMPSGCRFAERCTFTMDICRSQEPPMIAVGESEAACWLHPEKPEKNQPVTTDQILDQTMSSSIKEPVNECSA